MIRSLRHRHCARRALMGGGVALAALFGPLVAVLPSAVQAAESTTTAQFSGCEVRKNPITENQQIGGETTWSPTLFFAMPSPIASRDAVTVDVQLGALPANTLPEDLTNVTVWVYELRFVSEHWNPLRFNDEFHLATFDKDAPLSFPAMEYVTDYVDPGSYHHRLKSVELTFTGEDSNGDGVEYSFSCDQVVDSQSILTTSVYDTAAVATVAASAASAKQGGSVRVTGTNLLTAAPTTPAAPVTVTIGGIVVGQFPLNEAGGFSAVVTAPPYLAPGNRAISVANGTKVATTPLKVVAAAGRVSATPRTVQRGKQVAAKGASFAPGETVKVTLKGGKRSGKKAYTKTVRANSAGRFTVRVTLTNAARGGWRITTKGASSGRAATTTFKVK